MNPSEWKPRTLKMYREIETLYEGCVTLSYDLGTLLQDAEHTANFTKEDMTDVGFLLRECESFLDASRKEIKNKKELLSKVLAYRLVTKNPLSTSKMPASRGEWATARPRISLQPQLPAKESPAWHAIMEHFGVSEEARKWKLMQLHWKYLCEYLTDCVAKGIKPPADLDVLKEEATVTFTRQRNSTLNDVPQRQESPHKGRDGSPGVVSQESSGD